jgi:RNA polymerase sigma-70 factor, ECF subfamily
MSSDELQYQRDKVLVRVLLRGDQKAFKQFVDEYFPKLYRYAKIRLGNDHDVEDVVQSTLSNAARYLHTYRGESSLLTWLVGICRREISQFHGRRAARSEQEIPYLGDEGLRFLVDNLEAEPSSSPLETTERLELLSLIQLALDQLPPTHADALQWKYVEGCSSQEIATRMGIGDEAVQSLLARARASFRATFAGALELIADV